MADFSFEALRRFPDVEAPNLVAVDATDRLILDEAAEALAAAPTGTVVVIGDRYGALTLGAAALHGATAVRTHQDALTGERALAANADRAGLTDTFTSHDLDATLLTGARVVLLQLPRSLDALDEIAALVAEHADPQVVVVAGGRVKHMSVAMNEVLGRYLGTVEARLARQKSRVLVASSPRPAAERPTTTWPASEHHAELGLTICAHGSAFAGTRLDLGTRFLLGSLDAMAPDATRAVDLGCGTGVVAAALAVARPALQVVATDDSAAAVASALATARANGVADRVEVLRDDAAATLPDSSVDLVVLNPPFHVGASVHTGVAHKLFAAAGRVLRPGGELWTVWNSHLLYRPALERAVGPTRQVARNAKFTVTASTKR
ncbi:class I SAM-dependent methyltransferase [Cellulomonas soli]|uniref:Ribosomal RNA large subunit methyltransferase G n=1 Tax=Cellulomonas soli TaxID=931535 RepID=A0A512PDX7_9CELL|nr:methyltransferase [Cellulomonas soli]NYI59098.1 16S rRNA (guanine1207-N2)-methyltransferase [Cellulomonas soli]GEP69411.1 ribosomal RNA large subunit methyltransferase G [Cellulomonas soli]